jgi:uncharacterized membrane protein YheB (UPF0754 family)
MPILDLPTTLPPDEQKRLASALARVISRQLLAEWRANVKAAKAAARREAVEAELAEARQELHRAEQRVQRALADLDEAQASDDGES